jgi:hypothetical protein
MQMQGKSVYSKSSCVRRSVTRSRPGSDSRRGGVLVVTILITVVLLLMGAGLARMAHAANESLDSRIEEKRALFLAEAALAESVSALRAGGCGCVGTVEQPARLGDGALWSEAEELGLGRFRVRSTGLAGGGRAALEAVVAIAQNEPLFRYTLNSDEVLTVNQGVSVDSFSSRDGTYTSQIANDTDGFPWANDNGDVASNQDIVLNSDAHVFGDATPGTAGTVTFNTGSYVAGSTASASEPFNFQPVPIPDWPQDSPLIVPSLEHEVLPSGQYGFTDLEIGNAGSLTVEGPARVLVDSFSGFKDGRLVIDASAGPVTFYVKGSYFHDRGFEAVPAPATEAAPESPMAVAFLIEGNDDIVFPSFANVRGAYYAPHASILFSNYNEAWGSFAGRRIEMSNDMRFHFDEVLTEYWEADGSVFDSDSPVEAWVRTAVQPASLERDRRDPFVALGVDPEGLPTPGEAWQF